MVEQLLAYVMENKKRAGMIAGSILVVFFLSWKLLSQPSTEKLEHPDGYMMVCKNPSCGHEFVVSVSAAQAWRAKHAGEAMKCPKCGQSDVVQKGSRDDARDAVVPTGRGK